MSNLNKITKVLGASFVLAASTNALAAETATATATVSVLNAFTLTADTALDFGTIRATADDAGDGTNIATLVMSADPGAAAASGTTNNAAEITVLTAGSPAEFSVSGVAAFSNLTVTLPVVESSLVASGLPGTAADFTINTFTAFITSGGNSGSAYSASNLQADNTGAVTFNVGATLSTDDAGSAVTQNYQDSVAYTGTFDVEVDY